MRPDLSEELIKRVIEKWKKETNIVTDIPTSKIIEDILLRYLEGMEKIRDRKRDRLLRKFLKMKYAIKPGYQKSPIRIKNSKRGSIIINNKKYEKDLMISYKGLLQEMNLESNHLFSWGEMNILLVENPDVIVFGKGYNNCLKISPNVMKLAKLKDVEILDDTTPKAIENFKQLLEKNKKVVGFFHVTC